MIGRCCCCSNGDRGAVTPGTSVASSFSFFENTWLEVAETGRPKTSGEDGNEDAVGNGDADGKVNADVDTNAEAEAEAKAEAEAEADDGDDDTNDAGFRNGTDTPERYDFARFAGRLDGKTGAGASVIDAEVEATTRTGGADAGVESEVTNCDIPSSADDDAGIVNKADAPLDSCSYCFVTPDVGVCVTFDASLTANTTTSFSAANWATDCDSACAPPKVTLVHNSDESDASVADENKEEDAEEVEEEEKEDG